MSGPPLAGGAGDPGGESTHGYHQPFLPEYVTTIAISLAANWLVLALSEAEQLPVEGNPHVYGAVAAYTAVIFTLLGLTAYHRYRFCTVTLAESALERSFLGIALSRVPFEEIESVEERRGRFFGRRARQLVLRTRALEEVVVTDFIHHYGVLKESLLGRAGRSLTNTEPLSDAEFESLHLAARLRDLVFGRPRLGLIQKRLPVRLLALMPVVGVEALGAALVIFEVFGGAPGSAGNPYAVYAGAVTLAISGLVARSTYYYIFSTHWLESQKA